MYDLIMEQNDHILLRSTRLLSDVGVGEGVEGSCSISEICIFGIGRGGVGVK